MTQLARNAVDEPAGAIRARTNDNTNWFYHGSQGPARTAPQERNLLKCVQGRVIGNTQGAAVKLRNGGRRCVFSVYSVIDKCVESVYY